MTRDIRPLTVDDLPELSRFLTAGFHASPDADFVALEVLRWKYFDQDAGGQHVVSPTNSPRSYIARGGESGGIIGHVGFCLTTFEGQGIAGSVGQAATMHFIDWLGSPNHRSVGLSLGRMVQLGVATQFFLGVSQAALAVGERAGYKLRSLVPVYLRVLQAGYWLRAGGLSPVERVPRLARDLASRWTRRVAAPRATIALQRVSAFDAKIAPIVAKAKTHAVLTSRDPARLNEMLRFPRQAMSGWHLLDDTGRLRGLAILNVVPKDQGRTRTGKVVDCLLDDNDPARWHAATLALTRELARQGADLAEAYASTPWAVEALSQSGYTSRFAVKFHIRDLLELIPGDATFHLTPLEGDYAYT